MSDHRPERVTERTYRMRRDSTAQQSRFAARTYEPSRGGFRPSRFASGAQRVVFRRNRPELER